MPLLARGPSLQVDRPWPASPSKTACRTSTTCSSWCWSPPSARGSLANGAEPPLDWENDKPTVLALREIAAGHVGRRDPRRAGPPRPQELPMPRARSSWASSAPTAASRRRCRETDTRPTRAVAMDVTSSLRSLLPILEDASIGDQPARLEARGLPPARRGRARPGRLRLRVQAHQGQRRRSGEPYITHPVAVADILADLHLDCRRRSIAAILHDVIEDTPTAKEEISAALRQRGRGARRRRQQARPDPVQEPRGGAGRELPQDAARDGARHPRDPGQARRPPAQHAHARRDAAGQAPHDRARDARDLRADRATASA